MPASEWKKCIEVYDLYDEKIAPVLAITAELGIAYLEYLYGIPNGDALSEFYAMADNWSSDNLSQVVLDARSRYISNAIYNKQDSENVSILMFAYEWIKHEGEDFSPIEYQYPWENNSRFFE